MQMRGRRRRARPVAWLLPFGALAGCNALWGIDDVERRLPGQAGSDAAGAGGTSAVAGASGGGIGGGTAGRGGDAGGDPGGGAAGAGGGEAGAGGAPCEARLVINEVQAEGPDGGTDEFVELYNAGACEASLEGHRLEYLSANGGVGVTYWALQTPGRTLAPGAFFLVGSANFSGPTIDELPSTGQGMAKNGAGLALFAGDVLLDSLAWGVTSDSHPYLEGTTSAGIAEAGESIARLLDGLDTQENAADFQIDLTPSPRSANAPLPR